MVHKLVQKHHSFVILRRKTYYFRYAFPLNLRKLCPWLPAEIKRSLRTDSFSEAVALVDTRLPLIKLLKNCTDAFLVEGLVERLTDFTIQIGQWVEKQFKALTGLQKIPQKLIQSSPRKKSVPRTPRLSVVWKEYVQWKTWTPRRASQNQRTFDNLLFFLGDRPVGKIAKADLKQALDSISRLPVRHKRPYSRMTLKDIKRREIPESDRISSKSVKEHLKLAQSIFNAYLVRERDVLERSPTEGVRYAEDKKRYGCLTDAQVRQVLERSKEKPEWFHWFIKLAVYSGARRSEIAFLRKSDFKFCEDTKRDYFVIREGKTKAAQRMIPLHSQLIEDGFKEWIDNCEDLIFSISANTPNRVTHNFASLLDEKVSDMGERLVFHSTRHTFVTKARASGANTALIQQVVGHEKTGAGMTDRYTHNFQMKDVLSVIDCISYG